VLTALDTTHSEGLRYAARLCREAGKRAGRRRDTCDAFAYSIEEIAAQADEWSAEATHERAATQYIMRRLDGFARGLGLDEAAARQIVEQVVADMPRHTDEERLDVARQHMIIASA